ncbi:hypothetical protein N374_gp192 [Bacillus phage phiNIT1]|uniref:Uncharacterized protein n=1 Tax=Bacillus phage phiNIT1 TaxID=207656 RepID=S6BVE4_9CAUD|nr:hypothetical protein N374_gp192 [Bacillus phage phiNIT1]BAN59700.1 hypothetical protein [Bacillus phage phiNIT1]
MWSIKKKNKNQKHVDNKSITVYNKINKSKGEIKMTIKFTDGIKEELLDRVEHFENDLMENHMFDMREDAKADIKYLKYGIKRENVDIIRAVYALTHDDSVCAFVADLLEVLARNTNWEEGSHE